MKLIFLILFWFSSPVALDYPSGIATDIVWLGNMGAKDETRMSDPIRKWLFSAENENGDSHYISDEYFIGTYREATDYAETKCDEFEEIVGGLILKLTIESHGKVE